MADQFSSMTVSPEKLEKIPKKLVFGRGNRQNKGFHNTSKRHRSSSTAADADHDETDELDDMQ